MENKRLKLGKKVICGVLAFATSATMMVSAWNVSTAFSKKYVDSNQETYVTTATRQDQGEAARVIIDSIYQADGSQSSYKRIKGNIRYKNSSGQWKNLLSTYTTIKKGEEKVFIITNAAAKKSGATYHFYAKGNDPALDCRISGKFEAQ